MRKWLNNPWIAALLAIVAIGAVVQSLWPQGPLGAPAAGENGLVSDDSTAVATDAALGSRPLGLLPLEPVTRELFPLAAPLATDATATEETPKATPFRLSAVWTQEGRTLAVINDTVVEIGDRLASYTLQSIESQGAWLQIGEERTFLALGKDTPLRSVPGPRILTTSH